MYKYLVVLITLFYTVPSFAQKLICDSLLRKDPDFWYSNADFISQGKVIKVKDHKKFSNYSITPNRAFVGASTEFILRQYNSEKWFHFEPDTNYVFFVFEKYQDAIFKPCVLFGKASKMEAVIERYGNYCGSAPIKEECYCPPYYDPVCGCDGYNYKNPCEAACDGVLDYFKGPCLNITPIRVKEETGD